MLALFTADAFADFGRSDAQVPSARSEGTTLASGEIHLADSGPCGTVNDAIDAAHKFLVDAGIVGSIIKKAAGAAVDAVSTAIGVAAIKKVIAVVNVVMNTASLITPWKVTTELSNGGSYLVGTNGTTGEGGTLTVTLEGAVSQPDAAVSACLQLIGVQDPTDQKGSTLQWAGYDGYVSGVTPSLLVRGTEPAALDENNRAVLEFSTGTQDIDTSKAELTVDANVHVSVRVERGRHHQAHHLHPIVGYGDHTSGVGHTPRGHRDGPAVPRQPQHAVHAGAREFLEAQGPTRAGSGRRN